MDNIPFELDIDTLLSKVRANEGSEDAKHIQDLVNNIAPKINPKAIYEVSYVEDGDGNAVNIGGVIFHSRALRVNLDKVERVFPYIATCGMELEETDIPSDDFMRGFWMDTIKAMALGSSMGYLKNHLKERYALGKISTMSPGGGDQDVWPIEQQEVLFSIFGNVEDLIGVKLTESFLMIPNKSVSGIIFPTEVSFESCQLCHRENCRGRRADFDKNLWEATHSDRI